MDSMKRVNMVMAERYCALAIGMVFLFIGIAGFVPALVSLPGATNLSSIPVDAAPGAYSAGFGYLFGIFPINFLHNLVHCSVGLLGIASFTNLTSARLFNRAFAISYTLIALMGLLPLAKTTFGTMPIFGNNVWFNALTAAAAGYYGFFLPTEETKFST